MKNGFLLFGMLLLFLSGKAQMIDASDIKFDQQVIELGVMKSSDAPRRVAFTFVNNSPDNFKISKVWTSCGCTKPKWPKSTIVPNQRGVVTITFNPQGIYGEFSKLIEVYGNFGNVLKKTLRIKGTVVNDKLRSSSNELYNYQMGYLLLYNPVIGLDTISTLTSESQKLMFVNHGQRPYRIKGFREVPSFIKMGDPIAVGAGDTAYLPFTYSHIPKENVGLTQGKFYVITDDQYYPIKEVRIAYFLTYKEDLSRKQYRKRPKIEIGPKSIDLGSMNQAAKKSSQFTISNNGKSDLNIVKIKTDCSCTVIGNYPTTIKSGETVKINVEFDSLFKSGKQAKSVDIFTNDPDHPFVSVLVKAMVYKH